MLGFYAVWPPRRVSAWAQKLRFNFLRFRLDYVAMLLSRALVTVVGMRPWARSFRSLRVLLWVASRPRFVLGISVFFELLLWLLGDRELLFDVSVSFAGFGGTQSIV